MSAPVEKTADANPAPVQAAPIMNQEQQQQQPIQAAPAAAPPAQGGPVNDQDMKIWTNRANDFLANPSGHLNSRAPAGAQSWAAGFFDCFNPIDTCLITWCLPCITFGKAQHRIHRSGELEGYEPVNTSCLLLLGAAYVGCFCIPIAMQRQMVREKYNLEGNCAEDILRSWCCGCCTIMQHDKEAEHREQLLRQGSVDTQYKANAGGMTYPAQ